MSEDGSTLARRQLGKYLRDGREECGLTLERAAALIQRSASALQRIEKGTVTKVREVDLEALCRICEFDADHTAAMKGLAAQGNEDSWWYEYGDLIPANFDFFVGLEASAERLTSYEPELVPGLLQTPAYAAALFHAGYPDDSGDEHARRVQLRMRRQARITRKHSPVVFDVVLRESVIRGIVGGPRTMGKDTFTEVLYLAKPVVVQRYHEAYEYFQRSALDAVASRALLRQIAKEYAS
jgi:transcriptional regulator with XRE-family HTH domain